MPPKEIPIHDFGGLRTLLKQLGYLVPEATGYRPLKIIDVDINDINSNIEFRSNGIFVCDSKYNISRQVFLYKREYHLTEFGKPKYHICKCKTIQKYGDTKYRCANTGTVKVIDLDDYRRDKEVDDLPLCKNCIQSVNNAHDINSSEFAEILKQASKQDNVDIFGYTRDWPIISAEHRKKSNYTCEGCGRKLASRTDQFYLHVHHVNGNKADNSETNLRCLCIRCHSKVDDNHRDNFSRGSSKKHLDEYNKKYP